MKRILSTVLAIAYALSMAAQSHPLEDVTLAPPQSPTATDSFTVTESFRP